MEETRVWPGGTSTIITPLTDMITVANMVSIWYRSPRPNHRHLTEISNIPTWISSLGGSMNGGTASTTTGFPPPLYAGFVSPNLSVNSYSIAVPSFSYPTKGTSATGSSGAGKDFFAFLDNCRASRNIPIMYQTPGKQLIQNPTTNEILGVIATNWTGQDIYVRANKGVILACGGYENNPEIKANFAPESPID